LKKLFARDGCSVGNYSWAAQNSLCASNHIFHKFGTETKRRRRKYLTGIASGKERKLGGLVADGPEACSGGPVENLGRRNCGYATGNCWVLDQRRERLYQPKRTTMRTMRGHGGDGQIQKKRCSPTAISCLHCGAGTPGSGPGKNKEKKVGVPACQAINSEVIFTDCRPVSCTDLPGGKKKRGEGFPTGQPE